VLAGGLVAGILVGMIVRRFMPVMVGLLGFITCFLGVWYIFAVISITSGEFYGWLAWTLSLVIGVAGLLCALKFCETFVLIGTSFCGSYMFVRAWTLIFPGNWPSDAEIVSGDVEINSLFWVFFSLVAFFFVLSLVWQKKHQEHDDLKDYTRKE